jgi:transposase-like protein
MPKAYSGDLRERVIEQVESGASRHEAAEQFDIPAAGAFLAWRSTQPRYWRCKRKNQIEV